MRLVGLEPQLRVKPMIELQEAHETLLVLPPPKFDKSDFKV